MKSKTTSKSRQPAPIQSADGLCGVELISAERKRQISKEGWTTEHDDKHDDGSIASAASSYLTEACGHNWAGDVPHEWPWEPEWWKPSADPVRNLVKAGALIAAEIDRLQRSKRNIKSV